MTNFKKISPRFLFALVFLFQGCDEKCDEQSASAHSSLKPILYDVDVPSVSLYSPSELPDEKERDLTLFEAPQTKLIGYKNKKGKIVIEPQFEQAHPFTKTGIAAVYKGGKDWYTIDKSGQILFKNYFFDNGPDYYVSGLTRFVDKGKIGFADKNGKIVIPATFDFALAFSFSEPITIVSQGCREEECHSSSPNNCHNREMVGGKWGAIDKQGKIVIPIEYDKYEPQEDTISLIKDKKVYKLYLCPKEGYKLILTKK